MLCGTFLTHQHPGHTGTASPAVRWGNQDQSFTWGPKAWKERKVPGFDPRCPGTSPHATSEVREITVSFQCVQSSAWLRGNTALKVAYCLFQLDHKYTYLRAGDLAQGWSTCLMAQGSRLNPYYYQNKQNTHGPESRAKAPWATQHVCFPHSQAVPSGLVSVAKTARKVRAIPSLPASFPGI